MPIRKNTLCNMTKTMTTNLDMDSKQIINKIGRVTIGISHMEDVFILVEYGMAIIGRYDVNITKDIISQQGY
jgi:hypothetical protein